MIVGCYTLNLYCDNVTEYPTDKVHGYNEFPHEYTDELGSKCREDARRDGWILKHDGTAICPKCSGKRKRPKDRNAFEEALDQAEGLTIQEIFKRKAQEGHDQ